MRQITAETTYETAACKRKTWKMQNRSMCLFIVVCLITSTLSSNASSQVRVARGRVAIPLERKLNELAEREVFFVKKVCKPNETHLRMISESANKKVKEMQKMYLDYSKNRAPATWPRPQAVIIEHLQTVVAEIFPSAVSDAYNNEIAARHQANLTATASIVTNLIDSQVLLSHDEIDAMENRIIEFDTTKNATLPVAFFYQHMIPIPTSQKMESLLTARQLALWKTQKHPNYNQPWVNYFNSNDFLSVILPPGVAADANNKKLELRRDQPLKK